jgi:glycosyltransferase involved in cell wall biosynthesis
MKELHCNCYAYLHGHSMGGTNPALLKALGYGNCILALDTVFNREVLDDKYGIIFKNDVNDLVNKLQEIIENPSKAENYRRNAPNRITEAYTWEKIINDYEKLFKSVLS